ncbi:alpha/beta fold hydrolase [Aurantibacillus circumpalustris]|uniref:alpha/beta fold hydrolase n=1 Tax=Aurantibacillus circumpalustris TaxID=3036359 RepID=UPI00295B5E5A|nr:alpha/beta hydrolase [Aurantibacillus circumpalustris]
MKTTILFSTLTLLTIAGCNNMNTSNEKITSTTETVKDSLISKNGYSEVNGIKMYYEIYGQGNPLVLIHGGGSTIQTSFGKVIPLFAKHRQLIAVELQAHGRTGNRDTDLSFEQDAEDVVALLKNLRITKADFFGFSNGGTTSMQIAIRHPEIVNALILGSALCKRNGVPEQFWDFMKQAHIGQMPEQLKEAYNQVAANPDGLQVMHDRDVKRMLNFKDIPDEQIKSIKAPTLIIIGDKDVITPEHALEMHKLISNSQLAIIPGGHGEYMGEITTLKSTTKESEFIVPHIEKFIKESSTLLPK